MPPDSSSREHKFTYRILLQIIQNLYIQYFYVVRICIMIIGLPDFLYCCILLIMVLCHGRSQIKQKTKKQNNKNCQNRLQKKTENKFKKKERKYLH